MAEEIIPSEKNPIVEYCHGLPVRKYNFIGIRLDPISYKELIETEFATGLSQRQILGYSSLPCNCCKETFVHTYTDNKGEVKIKRGLLSKRIPNGSGSSTKHKFPNEQITPTGQSDK